MAYQNQGPNPNGTPPQDIGQTVRNNLGQIGGVLGNIGNSIGSAWNGLQNFNKAPSNAYGVMGYTPGADQHPATNQGIISPHVQPTQHPTSVTTGADGSMTTKYPGYTPDQATIAQKNAQMMQTLGVGNYDINPDGTVVPKQATGGNVNQASPQQLNNNARTPEQIAETTNPITPSQNNNPIQYSQSIPPTVGSIAAKEANLLNNPSPQIQQDAQAIQDLDTSFANSQAGIQEGPGEVNAETGVAGVLQNKYANLRNAAVTKYQNDLAEQGQGITALGQAGGQVSPLPGNALGYFNPASQQTTPYNAQGGAFGAGQVGEQLQQGAQYQGTIAPALNAANAVLNGGNGYPGLTQFLAQNPNINPSNFNLVNQLKSWALGQNYSDKTYPELSQYINEMLGTLSPVVGATGNPTDFKQGLVQSMINSTSSNASLQDQLNNLMQIAQSKAQAIYSTGQGAANPSNTGTNLGENSVSLGGSNWVKDANGQWVVSQ
jgi:hypothetical protein